MANPRQENILFHIANSKASKQIVATSCGASRFESEHFENISEFDIELVMLCLPRIFLSNALGKKRIMKKIQIMKISCGHQKHTRAGDGKQLP